MTSLQGYIETTYNNLVSVFGPPNSAGDPYKVSAEWKIDIGNGEYIYIYDWKQYSDEINEDENEHETYLITPMGKYDWHIGGSSKNDVETIKDLINKKEVTK